MTQTTPERQPCGTCGNEYTVTANGTIRHHFTDNPDFQAGPDSRKCKGAGQPPAGPAGIALAEDMEQPQCRMCKHPVVLTSNGRARSHLTPESQPRPCPGGSDFPLGTYPDLVGTTDGLVATLAFDCEHREVGACYDCHTPADGTDHVHVPDRDQYGDTACIVCGKILMRRPQGVTDAELVGDGDGTEPKPESAETITRTGTNTAAVAAAPWGVNAETVAQPTMADQLKATPLTALTGALAREVGNPGTVLDVMDGDARAEAERFMAAVQGASIPEQPTARTLNHTYMDPSGVKWVHDGTRETCETPECELWRRIHPDGVYCAQCDTDTHQCPGCGEHVPHGTVACDACDRRVVAEAAERQAKCTHPDGFGAPLHVNGVNVPACGHCNAVAPGDNDSPDAAAVRDIEAVLADLTGKQVREDAWRTPDDLLAKMPEDVQRLDALRLNCTDCGHPVTPRGDQFDLYGVPQMVVWHCREGSQSGHRVCRDHECKPDTWAEIGDLRVGEHFVRRGAVMRVTDTLSGDVHAVVVDGPMKGRTGVLPDNHETVERTHCRHEYDHNGRFCDYCAAPDPATETTTEQETTECTDDRTRTQQQPSSEAQPNPTTAPAFGSRQPSPASAPAVLSGSTSMTSSAPTAGAAGNGRSAAVTTDQSAAAAAFLGGGRQAAQPAPAGPTDQAAAAAQFLAGGSGAHGEKETKRDRFGRYLIPHPDTGREQAWTRATTFAKSISDTYALSQWGLRMALLGATMRPDIVQRAHGKHVSADKQLLDELTAELKNAAGDKVAANLGTSMHSFKELADRAWHSPGGPRSVMDRVPPDCREDIETYIRLLSELGLEPVPHLVEFTTVVKQYGVAGTSDNCYKVTRPLALNIGRAEVRLSPGEYVIADLKTGKDLDYGWQEIAIQLGVYAQGLNTAGVWDRHEEKWEPDPLNGAKVRLDAGIVVHLPVDKSGRKQPAVYGIDLESGWNAAVLCERVRTWRKVRNLASPVMVSQAEPDTFTPTRPAAAPVTVHPPTLADRANAVTSKGEASAVWKQAKKDGLSDAEVAALVQTMQARLEKLAEPAG